MDLSQALGLTAASGLLLLSDCNVPAGAQLHLFGPARSAGRASLVRAALRPTLPLAQGKPKVGPALAREAVDRN